MKNKLDFYTKLISSILDCCYTCVVIIENVAIELVSFYGENPIDLDTLRLVVNNFESTKKSFSIIDNKDFQNTVENENLSSKNLNSIGYLPVLDENKIAIGYVITVFNKPFSILKNQENTVSLITNKIAEQLRNDIKEEDSHIANNELLSQTEQKTKLIAELIRANKKLAFQSAEKERQTNELIIANQQLAVQIQEQEKRAAELLIANLEIDFLQQEEHALFAAIVDSSDDAMLSTRLDGIITSWNHGAEQIFGYSAGEIIGKSISTLIPKHLEQEEVRIIDKIESGETVSNLKTERLKKDGTIFYAALTISPIKNFDGDVIGASKVLRDITEQYNIEVEKNQLAERLRLATQSAQLGIWDWDLENNKVESDENMFKLYGIASEDFNSVYEGWMSMLHDEDRQRVANELQLAVTNKKDYITEFRVVWSDSSVHYIKATGIVSRDDDGIAKRMIGVNWDITAQKEKEQHLKLLESVITNTTDSILITEAEPFDEPGPRILYVNDAFTKMTGYTAADVIGKTPRILQGPKSDRTELKRLSEAIRRWETCEITTINYKKNGEEFWINFTLTPVANEKGWYTHWIAIERDVTVRKNEELQNKLIADISTVFSEPLKLHETLDRTLQYITNFGNFCFAEAWLTSSDQNILKKIGSHAATENSRLFLEETISVDTSIDGEGFTGVVAKTKEITIWGDLINQNLLRRRDAAVKYGLKTILGLPLLYNNEVIGVLVFGLDYEVVDITKYGTLFKKLGDHLSPEFKRKQLEFELNQMFNFAPDLIAIIGLDGCFNRVNPAACQLLGYTQKELCAEPYVNFIHPEDREKSTREIATLLESNLTYYFENRYITKSGKIKWLAWNGIYVAEDNSIYAVAKDSTEKKELENLFKKTNELARIGGWEVDLQNNTILWSDITKEIHEVPLDYIPDLETGIAFYKEGSNRYRITEYVQQAINTGKPWDDEFQIVTAKGNDRWVRAIGEAEFVNGNCSRIYGSFQDIDERKIIEQQKNSLLTTLEKSLNEIYVFDAETLKFSYVNPGALLNNGYSEQEIKELTPLDIKPEFTATTFNQLVNPLITKEKEKIIFFTNHKRKNGSLYPVEIHVQFVEEGNNKRFLAVVLDITERKKAESKLIESENYLRTILDNEPECVKVLNNKGELVSMNPAGLAMIEAANEQQVLGQRMTDLVNKEYWIGFNQLSAAVFKGNSGTFEFEITGLKGRQRWLETHAVPLKDTTGKIINLLGVTRDITERKANESKLILLNENLNKQQVELVTSNKELEQFAYIASHDLQEPLRMVTSFLTLLEKRYVNVLDEKGLNYINFAVDGAKRMRQIILDILEFSRINTNHQGNYESVDLKDIINDISLLQSKLIKEKKAKIIFEELPKMYSIRHYLMQLFQNIISNALKYSKEDIPLEIIIKSEEFDDSFQITVTDNGIGIEEEYYEKIFIIFQRLHGKEKYEGNGMGLAIVKKIVDKLNGKIWVESQVGVGSTFYINIPKKIR